MGGDSKRWTVTYTKHIKQKRKVYQDGALEHHNNKVLLYDDTGKVIDSRFLKKDEVVTCGGTLTFDSHLVDIGDLEGNHGPLKDLNVQGGDKKSDEKISTLNGLKKVDAGNIGKQQNRTLHPGISKVDAGSGHIGATRNHFNVLKKIKQEDEKSELHKFQAPQCRLKATQINDRGSKQFGQQNFDASRNCSNQTQTAAKEWHVLYTTQITQKAKKYHDGIMRLENCGSIQKQVLLYDASRTLLNSRFLKKDEVVRLGETVVFDGHLVEVGDPEGNASSLDSIVIPSKHAEVVAGARFKSFGEDRTSELQSSRATQSLLKATKINDRGSKQHEQQNLEASRNCSNPTQTTPREWHALYTTQLTQKAKKYHDGFIRLEFCGSYQKQVVLYDTSRKVLDSRFLKKDEVVRSGETVVFAAHLVDIGEPEASSLDGIAVVASKHAEIKVEPGVVNSSREDEESEVVIVEAPQNNSNLMQGKIREWHALYTTQVTQRAKRYHDGILQLAVCVSQKKQVILLNDDGTILSKEYLNSSEDVKAGCTLQVTNYLVQVGEPKISQPGESQNDASSGKNATMGEYSSRFSVDKIKLSLRDTRKKPICDGQSKDDTSSGKHVGAYSSSFSVDNTKFSITDASKNPLCDGQSKDDASSVKHVGAYSSSFSDDNTKSSISDASKKRIRDVHQILFTLKKPMVSESLAPTRELPMEQIISSRSSNSLHFDLEEKLLGHNSQQLNSSRRTAVDDHEHCGHLNGDGDRQMSCYRTGISESKAPQDVPTLGIINFTNPEHSDILDSDTILSNVSLGVVACHIPKSKSDVGNPGKRVANSFPSTEEPQKTDVAILDLPFKITEKSHPSVPKPQVSDTVLDLPDKSKMSPFSAVAEPQVSVVVYTRAEGSNGSGIAQDVKEEDSIQQVSADKMVKANKLEEGLSLGWPSTIDAVLESPGDAERQNYEILKSIPEEKLELDEFPSFDLGF